MAGEMSIKVNEWKAGQRVATIRGEMTIPETILKDMLDGVLKKFQEDNPQKEVIIATISVPDIKAVVVYRAAEVSCPVCNAYPEGEEQ